MRWAPPFLIVFSLVSRSYVLDLTPGNSFVEQLVAAGFDVFLLDWGVPDERDANNLLEDYVLGYLPAAIDRTRQVAGCDEVNMFGYCFGGDLALLYSASTRSAGAAEPDGRGDPGRFQQGGAAGGFDQGGADRDR